MVSQNIVNETNCLYLWKNRCIYLFIFLIDKLKGLNSKSVILFVIFFHNEIWCVFINNKSECKRNSKWIALVF